MTSAGNLGLDAFADAIAERILARLHQTGQPRLLSVDEAAAYFGALAEGTSLHDRERGYSCCA